MHLRYFTTGIIVVVFCLSLCANNIWTWQNPLPTGCQIMDIWVLNSKTVIAISQGGDILKSSDSGTTWSIAPIQNKTLRKVFFINDSIGWVIGDSGLICNTTDAGLIWNRQISGANYRLETVHFINKNTGLVGGSSSNGNEGIVLSTNDAGKTWEKQPTILGFGVNSLQMLSQSDAVALIEYDKCACGTHPGGKNINYITGMPTKKRITVPGAIAHIMARGIDGRDIFCDDADRSYFLGLLASVVSKTGYHCYGWVLMNNHYHLIVRTSEQPLNSLMRVLNSLYAKYYNTKYARRGYLFQDRFKSILSQDQHYLEELIRYVHLNPVRAGICANIKELDAYPWCGHTVLMGKAGNAFQTTEAVLRRFGKDEKTSRKNYREFIRQGIGTIEEEWIVKAVRESNKGVEKKDAPSCWVIGEQEFVSSVMKKNAEKVRTELICRQYWSLDKAAEKICTMHKIDRETFMKRNSQAAQSVCRKKFAFICFRILGYTVAEIARYIHLSGPAVSWAVKQGAELMTKRERSVFMFLPPG
jgi:REP element-mobilizing transposase RayT